MGWVEILLAVATLIGSPPAIFAAVRRYEAAVVVGVLAIGVLGAIVLIAGAIALMFNGYVEDTGMKPARTLPVAIPLLAIGLAVWAMAWRAARLISD
jgi:hypothetical protein